MESALYGWVYSLWLLWLVLLFVAIVAWVFRPGRKRSWNGTADIPLDEDR